MTLPGIGTLSLSGLAHPGLLILALVPVGLLTLTGWRRSVDAAACGDTATPRR